VGRFRFQRRSFEQHTILDGDGHVVGHLRIKPGAIWWKPAGIVWWYGVKLGRFAQYVKRVGVRKTRRTSRTP
jgi:hypothetical protein